MEFDKHGLESYITDPEMERTGVWLKFPAGRRIKILRAGGSNERYTRALQAAIKPHRRQLDRGTLEKATTDKIMRDVYARTVVIDWDGIENSSGMDVEFNHGNVVAFFEAFPELFTDVTTFASDFATFQEQEVEEAKDTLGKS